MEWKAEKNHLFEYLADEKAIGGIFFTKKKRAKASTI